MKSVREIEVEEKMNELETLIRASLLVRLGTLNTELESTTSWLKDLRDTKANK